MSYRTELHEHADKIYHRVMSDRHWRNDARSDCLDAATDAVAIKILNDLSEHARTQYGDVYGLVIDDWAIEKGIDLTGDDDEREST